ncbi:hypothetical protein [Pseudoxanthomonas mexicana]|uniref:hypothetical protein n=1 Tax=Pseudoxanthomonas mexicana TaxID=128785 RepID=UPI00398B0659
MHVHAHAAIARISTTWIATLRTMRVLHRRAQLISINVALHCDAYIGLAAKRQTMHGSRRRHPAWLHRRDTQPEARSTRAGNRSTQPRKSR